MQTNIKTEIALKMNEAEVCRSMGLLAESLSVYEQILTKKADLASQDEETIRNNIKEIKKEIADLEQVESQAVSEKEISFFKETMTSDQDIQAILDSASAFKDLGLHSEAIDEYKKLFFLDYDFNKIIPEITESFIKAHSPKKIIEQTDEIFKGDEIGKSKLALIILGFGKEMEKRDNREIALELYDSLQLRSSSLPG